MNDEWALALWSQPWREGLAGRRRSRCQPKTLRYPPAAHGLIKRTQLAVLVEAILLPEGFPATLIMPILPMLFAG